MIYYYTAYDERTGDEIERSHVQANDKQDAEYQIEYSLFHRELFEAGFEITGSADKLEEPML